MKKNSTAVERLSDYLVPVENNGELLISTGKSRFETAWKNKKITWAALLSKLSKSVETPETHAEYMKMGKEQQDRIKDIGGFVGGIYAMATGRPASWWPGRSSPWTWTSLRLTSGMT